MDRAYPSFETAYLILQEGAQFLFRCKENFSNEIKKFCLSNKTDQVVEIKAKQNKAFTELPYSKDSTLSVRLIKIKLEGGETEILMTSLLDTKEYPLKEFKTLYNQRWGVETFYDRFKNIISVESFSGTSFDFIQQEFNCALYMSNMQTILTQDAQNEALERSEDKQYEYKINKSLSLSFIRSKLFDLYTTEQTNDKILQELKLLFTQHIIPVRPGRKNIRDIKKYRGRIKPKQFKNRRLIF